MMDDTEEQSQKLQSNEEVIEELTRDLESSCIEADKNSVQNFTSDADTNNSNVTSDSWDVINKEHNGNNSNNAQSTDFLEDIDEELLKDREVDLTEAEKVTLKDKAEKLKNEGNVLYKDGEYAQAISIYTQGLQTCPLAYDKERSILYANRAAAKTKCQTEKDSAISDCTKAIELNSSYVKAYIRRAQLYEETDKLDEALDDFKKVLTFDPSHTEANHAIRRLPPLINERNEKLKTEMLSKLKDLGNMVLKPFGLSTNNFELQQDPNSGGYSVKFKQDPR
ncbi:PREDICTED: tetratricopeptide repeat protein 1 [Dinoponera quadriceps]|uniref:Tetratricopeptide repeat protein 1 n=1 Tax=Dinoponera quadriceps TaxID=609295 RepID=A0A6P3YBS8_DINQU|nr:PREDICTED: tetratricopeptide repeat protein 1 [Dinoponera quadriceps]